MFNPRVRNLCQGLVCLVIALSQSLVPTAPTAAQSHASLPKPSASFATNAGPQLPPAPVTALGDTQAITRTPTLSPEQRVRDIQAKGRAILYPGHVLTPTEQTGNTQADAGVAGRGPSNVMISGTVIVSDTGLPISYVRVVFYQSNGYALSAFTNRLGRFTQALYSGITYTLRVDPSQVYPFDLAGEWYDDQTLSNTATIITPTSTLAPLQVALNPGAQITGTIVASDTGAPLAGMTLAVYDANGVFLHSVLSDDAGHYMTGGLRSGSYTLCAYAYAEANPVTRDQYPGGCYNHADTPATATPLTVTSPTPLPNITVSVPTASYITGVVTADDTGAPLANIEVDVFNQNGTTGQFTHTDSNGRYIIRGLRPDAYKLYFSTRDATNEASQYISEFYDGKQGLDTADVITVTAAVTVSNINATLDLPGSITGVVTAEDTNAPLSGVRVFPISQSALFWNDVSTDASGVYTLSKLYPGAYKIFFSTLGTTVSTTRPYFGRYYTDGNGSSPLNPASLVTVTVNQTTGGINVKLNRGGQITGVVNAKDTGLGLEHVLVQVKPVPTLQEPFTDYFVQTSLTDSQGHYTVTAPGGRVTVSFLPYFRYAPYCGQFYNQHNTEPFANPVSVVAGQVTPNVNALLNHTSSISGTVTAADTGAPLAGVYVQLRKLNRTYYPFDSVYDDTTTGTDAQGQYVLDPLCAGQYKLHFDPSYGPTQTLLYAPIFNNQKQTDATSDVINLGSGVALPIDAALNRLAYVTGTITAADTGDPIPYAEVLVLDPDGNVMNEIGHSSSISEGRYFLGLPAGRYKLYLKTYDTRLANEYFGEAANFEQATLLEITATQVLSNINFALQTGGLITGQITDIDSGEPISYATVEIYDPVNPRFKLAEARADDEGNYYTTNRLRAGNYKLRFTSGNYLGQYFGGGMDFNSATPVSVTQNLTTTASTSLLSIQSPRLSTRIRVPIVLRQASDQLQTAPKPIT